MILCYNGVWINFYILCSGAAGFAITESWIVLGIHLIIKSCMINTMQQVVGVIPMLANGLLGGVFAYVGIYV